MMKENCGDGIKGLFSIDRCRKILNRHGNSFTNDEIIKIRDWLIQLAEIEYLNFKKTTQNEQKCNPLHSSFYG
jgi:hypothetical protein